MSSLASLKSVLVCARLYLSLRPLPRIRQGHHALWRLHQLKQHAAAAYGRLRVPFGVDEGDVVAGGTATDTAGGEAHALACRVRVSGLRSWLGLGLGFWSGEVTLQVLNRRGQLVDPEADVVERGHVDLPRVKRTDVMGFHAVRMRHALRLLATPSPWDVKQGSAWTRGARCPV